MMERLGLWLAGGASVEQKVEQEHRVDLVVAQVDVLKAHVAALMVKGHPDRQNGPSEARERD